MGGKQKRKQYSREFQIDCVRAMRQRGSATVADLAAELGVTEGNLHAWQKRFRVSPGVVAAPADMRDAARATQLVLSPSFEREATIESIARDLQRLGVASISIDVETGAYRYTSITRGQL